MGKTIKPMKRLYISAVSAVTAIAIAIACSRGAAPESPTAPAGPAPAGGGGTFTVKSDGFISDADRIWFKKHAVDISIDDRVVSLSATNPWDHPVRQGDAVHLWMKVFDQYKGDDKGKNQPFKGQAGPVTLGPKETVNLTFAVPDDGTCGIEVEFGLDDAAGSRHTNGGPAYYLFGVGYFQLQGERCGKVPRLKPSCEVKPVDDYLPENQDYDDDGGDDTVYCDLCDNIEGDQQELPYTEDGRPYIRTFDREGELFTCSPPPPDVCPNLEGVQETVPYGYILVEGECVLPPPPPPVDVCPNLEGLQTTVPEGYKLVEGQCVPLTCEELNNCPPPPPPVCYNFFFKMNQGNAFAARNACQNRGGSFEFIQFVPNGVGLTTNVCTFSGPTPPGSPGNDMTYLTQVETPCGPGGDDHSDDDDS